MPFELRIQPLHNILAPLLDSATGQSRSPCSQIVANEVDRVSLPYKPFVASLPAFKPPAMPPGVIPVADLSSNENPLGPSPKAVDAMRAALGTVNRYPDATSAALKEALACTWGLKPTNVAMGNGADEWVLLLCISLLNPGDEVIIAEGSFVSYLLRAREAGAELVRIPLRQYTHDLRAMAAAITGRTRLVFVCNPNNPTGTIAGAAQMQSFLDQVPDSVPVVLDEAYYEYALGPGYFDSVGHIRGGRENLIVLRSFSKVYGLAGLRVGYLLGHERLVDYAERARPPFNVNRLAQVAAIAALDDEDHVQRSVESNEAAKAFFYRELDALRLDYVCTHANFIAVDVRRPGTEVSSALLERGFVTTPLEGWGVPGHIRFSFGTVEQNRLFAAALAEVLG